MATTTTVIGGGIGLGLGAAALAGAIGLGLAAAAFSHRGRGNKGHGGYGHGRYGHGGYGHGHGGGHGGGYGYGHGRKRRSTEESAALDRTLDLIRQEDVTGCGLRLVCELASSEEDQLTIEELSILNLLGPMVQPGEGTLPSNGLEDYRAAKSFGQDRGDCSQAFPLCPLNGTQLMDTVMAYLP